MPRSFAARTFTISSNREACWMGSSPAFAPRRTLSTSVADSRQMTALRGG
jgi:hypothetical protein